MWITSRLKRKQGEKKRVLFLLHMYVSSEYYSCQHYSFFKLQWLLPLKLMCLDQDDVFLFKRRIIGEEEKDWWEWQRITKPQFCWASSTFSIPNINLYLYIKRKKNKSNLLAVTLRSASLILSIAQSFYFLLLTLSLQLYKDQDLLLRLFLFSLSVQS